MTAQIAIPPDLLTLPIFISALILIIGIIIARLFRMSIRRLLITTLPENTLRTLERWVYYGIIIVTVFVALGNLGYDFTAVLIAGGFLGIILGFATQSVVANAISGLFLHMDRSLEVGDSVEIVGQQVSGVVTDMSGLSLRIRTFDGVHVRIPNEKVFTSTIRNFSRHTARRIELQVAIAYKEDETKAIQLLKEMIRKNPMILIEPTPEVFVESLGDSGVNLKIHAWAPRDVWWTLRTQLYSDVKRTLEGARIEIPFPQRVVRLEGGEAAKRDTIQPSSQPKQSSESPN